MICALLFAILILLIFSLVTVLNDRSGHPHRLIDPGHPVRQRLNLSFRGTPEESVDEFVRRVDVEAALSSLNDRATVRLAVESLSGNAARWFEFMAFRPEELSWCNLRAWLREQYLRSGSPLCGAQRLLRIKFKIGEDFEDFAWRFRDLYLEWRPDASETEVAQALVEQLPDVHRLPLSLVNFHSVREVMTRVRRLSLPAPMGNSRSQVEIADAPLLNAPEVQHSAVENVDRRGFGRAGVRCYQCGGLGHIARFCGQGNARRGPG